MRGGSADSRARSRRTTRSPVDARAVPRRASPARARDQPRPPLRDAAGSGAVCLGPSVRGAVRSAPVGGSGRRRGGRASPARERREAPARDGRCVDRRSRGSAEPSRCDAQIRARHERRPAAAPAHARARIPRSRGERSARERRTVCRPKIVWFCGAEPARRADPRVRGAARPPPHPSSGERGHAEKDEPQPQVLLAWGFTNLNPAPWSPST